MQALPAIQGPVAAGPATPVTKAARPVLLVVLVAAEVAPRVPAPPLRPVDQMGPVIPREPIKAGRVGLGAAAAGGVPGVVAGVAAPGEAGLQRPSLQGPVAPAQPIPVGQPQPRQAQGRPGTTKVPVVCEATIAHGATAVPVPLPQRARVVADAPPVALLAAELRHDPGEAGETARPADGPEPGRTRTPADLRALLALQGGEIRVPVATEGIVGPGVGGVVTKVVKVAAARQVRGRTAAGVEARGLADTKATGPPTKGEAEPHERVAVVTRSGQQGRPARTQQVRSTKEIETLPEVPVVTRSTPPGPPHEGAVLALRVPRAAKETIKAAEAVVARPVEATLGRGRDRQDVAVPTAEVAAIRVAVKVLVSAPGAAPAEVATAQVGPVSVGLQGAHAAVVEVVAETTAEVNAGDGAQVRAMLAGPTGPRPAATSAKEAVPATPPLPAQSPARSGPEGRVAPPLVRLPPEAGLQTGPVRAIPAPAIGLAAPRRTRPQAVPLPLQGEPGAHAVILSPQAAVLAPLGVRVAKAMAVGAAPCKVPGALLPAAPRPPSGQHAQTITAVVPTPNAPVVRPAAQVDVLRPAIVGRRP